MTKTALLGILLNETDDSKKKHKPIEDAIALYVLASMSQQNPATGAGGLAGASGAGASGGGGGAGGAGGAGGGGH